MLKATANKGSITVEACGEALEVITELGMIIRGLHTRYAQARPGASTLFQIALRAMVAPDSPVWEIIEHAEGTVITCDIPKKREESDA